MEPDIHLAIAEAASQSYELINNMMHPAVMIDGRQNIVMFNNAARNMFGYGPDDIIIGRSLDILLPDDQRELHRNHVDGFAAGSEHARAMNNRNIVYGKKRDGTIFPTHATISKSGNSGTMMAILTPAHSGG